VSSNRITIHEDYANWSSEQKINNILILLDSLEDRTKSLQDDLETATNSKEEGKKLLASSCKALEDEEVKINDRVWLIKALEAEVREVIEHLTDEVQILKRLEQMENLPVELQSDPIPQTLPDLDSEETIFDFDGNRESSFRLQYLLSQRNNWGAPPSAEEILVPSPTSHSERLAVVRGERKAVESSLLQIISERETTIESLCQIQTLKLAAIKPPPPQTTSIPIVSPKLGQPSEKVYRTVGELDRERFDDEAEVDGVILPPTIQRSSSSDENGEAVEVALGVRIVKRRSSKDDSVTISEWLRNEAEAFVAESQIQIQQQQQQGVGIPTPNSLSPRTPRNSSNSTKFQSYSSTTFMSLTPTATPQRNAMVNSAPNTISPLSDASPINEAHHQLVLGLEKIWISEKRATEYIEELGQTVELRKKTLESLAAISARRPPSGGNTPLSTIDPNVNFPRIRRTSIITMGPARGRITMGAPSKKYSVSTQSHSNEGNGGRISPTMRGVCNIGFGGGFGQGVSEVRRDDSAELFEDIPI
jgi:hypothetical protein